MDASPAQVNTSVAANHANVNTPQIQGQQQQQHQLQSNQNAMNLTQNYTVPGPVTSAVTNLNQTPPGPVNQGQNQQQNTVTVTQVQPQQQQSQNLNQTPMIQQQLQYQSQINTSSQQQLVNGPVQSVAPQQTIQQGQPQGAVQQVTTQIQASPSVNTAMTQNLNLQNGATPQIQNQSVGNGSVNNSATVSTVQQQQQQGPQQTQQIQQPSQQIIQTVTQQQQNFTPQSRQAGSGSVVNTTTVTGSTGPIKAQANIYQSQVAATYGAQAVQNQVQQNVNPLSQQQQSQTSVTVSGSVQGSVTSVGQQLGTSYSTDGPSVSVESSNQNGQQVQQLQGGVAATQLNQNQIQNQMQQNQSQMSALSMSMNQSNNTMQQQPGPQVQQVQQQQVQSQMQQQQAPIQVQQNQAMNLQQVPGHHSSISYPTTGNQTNNIQQNLHGSQSVSLQQQQQYPVPQQSQNNFNSNQFNGNFISGTSNPNLRRFAVEYNNKRRLFRCCLSDSQEDILDTIKQAFGLHHFLSSRARIWFLLPNSRETLCSLRVDGLAEGETYHLLIHDPASSSKTPSNTSVPGASRDFSNPARPPVAPSKSDIMSQTTMTSTVNKVGTTMTQQGVTTNTVINKTQQQLQYNNQGTNPSVSKPSGTSSGTNLQQVDTELMDCDSDNGIVLIGQQQQQQIIQQQQMQYPGQGLSLGLGLLSGLNNYDNNIGPDGETIYKEIERSQCGRFIRYQSQPKGGAGVFDEVYCGYDSDSGREVCWAVLNHIPTGNTVQLLKTTAVDGEKEGSEWQDKDCCVR